MSDTDRSGLPFNFTIENDDLKLDPGSDLVLVDNNGRTVLRLDAADGVISVTAPSGRGYRLLFRGRDGDLRLGGNGRDANVMLYPRGADPVQPTDRATIHLDARVGRGTFGLPSEPGSVQVIGEAGHGVRIDGTGEVRASRAIGVGPEGTRSVAQLGPEGLVGAGGSGEAGRLDLRDTEGETTILANGGTAELALGGNGQDGRLRLRDYGGRETVLANGQTGNMALGGSEKPGILFLKGGSGDENGAVLNGERGDLVLGASEKAGTLYLKAGSGDGNGAVLNGERGDLVLGGAGMPGTVSLRTPDNSETVSMRAEIGAVAVGGSGVAGDVLVRNAEGTNTIHLMGDTGTIDVQGDIRFLNAGDLAESFALASVIDPAPGTVMVIGPTGGMEPCCASYDVRVAGVVSGAMGIRAGVILNAEGRLDRGPGATLSLAGRVAVLVDASFGTVRPGDPITTSPTRGHGMRADDRQRAAGALLGKALETLEEGRGLVKCLVALS